jgi:hypothetical protein
MEYTTQAKDRYYLDKVRRGLITPVDPTIEEADQSDGAIQRQFMEMLNSIALSRQWVRPVPQVHPHPREALPRCHRVAP